MATSKQDLSVVTATQPQSTTSPARHLVTLDDIEAAAPSATLRLNSPRSLHACRILGVDPDADLCAKKMTTFLLENPDLGPRRYDRWEARRKKLFAEIRLVRDQLIQAKVPIPDPSVISSHPDHHIASPQPRPHHEDPMAAARGQSPEHRDDPNDCVPSPTGQRVRRVYQRKMEVDHFVEVQNEEKLADIQQRLARAAEKRREKNTAVKKYFHVENVELHERAVARRTAQEELHARSLAAAIAQRETKRADIAVSSSAHRTRSSASPPRVEDDNHQSTSFVDERIRRVSERRERIAAMQLQRRAEADERQAQLRERVPQYTAAPMSARVRGTTRSPTRTDHTAGNDGHSPVRADLEAKQNRREQLRAFEEERLHARSQQLQHRIDAAIERRNAAIHNKAEWAGSHVSTVQWQRSNRERIEEVVDEETRRRDAAKAQQLELARDRAHDLRAFMVEEQREKQFDREDVARRRRRAQEYLVMLKRQQQQTPSRHP